MNRKYLVLPMCLGLVFSQTGCAGQRRTGATDASVAGGEVPIRTLVEPPLSGEIVSDSSGVYAPGVKDASAIAYGDVVALVEIADVYSGTTFEEASGQVFSDAHPAYQPREFRRVVLRVLRQLRATQHHDEVAEFVIPYWFDDNHFGECGIIPRENLALGTRGIAFVSDLNETERLTLATAVASPNALAWVWQLEREARERSARSGESVMAGQIKLWMYPENGTFVSAVRKELGYKCAKESGRPLAELALALDIPIEWLSSME